MSGIDFSDIVTTKNALKQLIFQVLDFKNEGIPKFDYIFKDFPDSKKLDFGSKLGTVFTFFYLEGIKTSVDKNMLMAAMRETVEDIHDDLKTRYSKV